MLLLCAPRLFATECAAAADMKKHQSQPPVRARKGQTVRGHDGLGPQLPKALLKRTLEASAAAATATTSAATPVADERVFTQKRRPPSKKQLRRKEKLEKKKRNLMRSEKMAREAKRRRAERDGNNGDCDDSDAGAADEARVEERLVATLSAVRDVDVDSAGDDDDDNGDVAEDVDDDMDVDVDRRDVVRHVERESVAVATAYVPPQLRRAAVAQGSLLGRSIRK